MKKFCNFIFDEIAELFYLMFPFPAIIYLYDVISLNPIGPLA